MIIAWILVTFEWECAIEYNIYRCEVTLLEISAIQMS